MAAVAPHIRVVLEGFVFEPTLEEPGLPPAVDVTPRSRGLRKQWGSHQELSPGFRFTPSGTRGSALHRGRRPLL